MSKKKSKLGEWHRNVNATIPPRFPVIWQCKHEGIILLVIRRDIDKPTEWTWSVRTLNSAGTWGLVLFSGKAKCFEHGRRDAALCYATRLWEMPANTVESEPRNTYGDKWLVTSKESAEKSENL